MLEVLKSLCPNWLLASSSKRGTYLAFGTMTSAEYSVSRTDTEKQEKADSLGAKRSVWLRKLRALDKKPSSLPEHLLVKFNSR